jgi:tetratricopeptide (TPR) repeat protein
MNSSFSRGGVLAALLLVPALAQAQSAKEDADALFSTKFVIDDANPSRSIPGAAERDAAPIDFAYFLMTLGEKAEAAEKRGEHAQRIGYLRALAAAVPNRSIGFSRLCAAYEDAKEYAEAEQSCGAAITLPGAELDDFARYVRVVFAQERDLSPALVERLKEVAAHVRHEAPSSPVSIDLECQLAVRIKDAVRYRTCSEALQSLPENDVKRVSYSWSWAMAQQDYDEAGALIQRAQASALPVDLIERMERVRLAQMPWWRRWLEGFASSRKQSL